MYLKLYGEKEVRVSDGADVMADWLQAAEKNNMQAGQDMSAFSKRTNYVHTLQKTQAWAAPPVMSGIALHTPLALFFHQEQTFTHVLLTTF